jgi:Tol biopolymer transport system component
VKNTAKQSILMAIMAILLNGCYQKEIQYYSNSDIAEFQETKNRVQKGDYQLSVADDQLIIDSNKKKFEISLPEHHSGIQSFHFSYDKRYLAYDVVMGNGVKIFVVDLEKGEKVNVSETIGYKYDYNGYQSSCGIAWAPDQNIIAFIGGYNDSARINIYHFGMDEELQAPAGSLIFDDIYGVKWDSTGESIYYTADSLENEDMYALYQTEIESGSRLIGGPVKLITEMGEKNLNQWLN